MSRITTARSINAMVAERGNHGLPLEVWRRIPLSPQQKRGKNSTRMAVNGWRGEVAEKFWRNLDVQKRSATGPMMWSFEIICQWMALIDPVEEAEGLHYKDLMQIDIRTSPARIWQAPPANQLMVNLSAAMMLFHMTMSGKPAFRTFSCQRFPKIWYCCVLFWSNDC